MRSSLIKCVTVVALVGLLQACCMPRHGGGPRRHRLTLEQTNQTSENVAIAQNTQENLVKKVQLIS